MADLELFGFGDPGGLFIAGNLPRKPRSAFSPVPAGPSPFGGLLVTAPALSA
jgi:hypothetical protein